MNEKEMELRDSAYTASLALATMINSGGVLEDIKAVRVDADKAVKELVNYLEQRN